MLIWLILSTVGLVSGVLLNLWIHTRYRLEISIRPAPPPPDAPLISVLIPARNEARNIAACIGALLNQNYPHYEIIVVDDRSTDATPQILADLARTQPRLQVIPGEPRPEGWAGKPHALAQAADHPRGEWLCFLDADTFAAPEMLSATLQAARATRADLFTILTRQKMGTFWEKVLLPVVFTALSVGFSPRRVNDPRRSDAIANGQFLLFRAEAYRAIGGHAAVHDSIVEDRDLARRIKNAGFRLVIAGGDALASTRMYTSLAEIWEGWTKNIFLGLSGDPRLGWLGLLGVVLCLIAAFLLPAWWIAGWVWVTRVGGLAAWIVWSEASLLWATLLIARAYVCRGMGISVLYALSLPLGTLVFAGMMLTSAWNVLTGRGVTWKGRIYRSSPPNQQDRR